jgi:prolyl oligopeptidase
MTWLSFLSASFFLMGSICFSSIQDPYLYLEDGNDVRTKQWLAEQKERVEKYQQSLTDVEPIKAMLERLEDRDFPKSFVRMGDQYLLHQRNALYIQAGLEAEPELLIDLDKEGAACTLVGYVPSPNGQKVAYGISENGSDWTSWYLLDINLKQSCLETTGKTKFSSICWSVDSLGFYYSCFDDQAVHGVYYHRVGTTQDTLIYQDLEHKSYFYIPRISSDRRYLLIDRITGSMAPNSILCLDLEHLDAPLTELIPFDGGTYWFVCNRGSKFYFTTTKDAAFRKLIVVDLKNPSLSQEIIAEKNALLADVFPLANHFLVCYEQDAYSQLFLFDYEGRQMRTIPLPDKGVVKFWHGYPDSHGTRILSNSAPVLFSFSNFITPPTLYKFDLDRDEASIFRESRVEVNTDDYSIRQIFYPSKDGTKIPLFLVHKKDLVSDAKTPTLLQAYGGFSASQLPLWDPLKMAWLKSGGMIASASVRGGGEYGTKWHLAGVKEKKQNSIDDLLAAAEWLMQNHYTNPSGLALYGFSNGALLAGACANQRPELFGAIVANVGVYDMLRYPRFSLGRFWKQEYGDPDEPLEFEFIKKYSPYHNVRVDARYPSMLIMTSDLDTRVAPWHSYKYAAALQEAQGGKILLCVKSNAGHFTRSSTDSATLLAFIMKELGARFNAFMD